MPQIDTSKNDSVKPYGVQPNTNQKLFQDRLLDRFKPHEYVKVKNVDDEPFMWQYMPAEKEDAQFTPDGMHRNVYRDEPEVWMLEPGEEETIVGANAYLMIEGLYKKLTSKKVIATVEAKPGFARSFNFGDETQQEAWIKRILVGKEVPTFVSANTTKESDEPIKRGPGRPAAVTQQ